MTHRATKDPVAQSSAGLVCCGAEESSPAVRRVVAGLTSVTDGVDPGSTDIVGPGVGVVAVAAGAGACTGADGGVPSDLFEVGWTVSASGPGEEGRGDGSVGLGADVGVWCGGTSIGPGAGPATDGTDSGDAIGWCAAEELCAAGAGAEEGAGAMTTYSRDGAATGIADTTAKTAVTAQPPNRSTARMRVATTRNGIAVIVPRLVPRRLGP